MADHIYAVIDEHGSVVNRVVGEAESPEGCSLILENDFALAIGGTFIGGVYAPPAESPGNPPPVASISRRQFFQQLAAAEIITEDEALAANAAVIPPPLLAIIAQMPAEQQFAAKMLVSGATVFDRHHSMTVVIGTAYGWSGEEIDDFFRAAALL